jgi:hypothetical protein
MLTELFFNLRELLKIKYHSDERVSLGYSCHIGGRCFEGDQPYYKELLCKKILCPSYLQEVSIRAEGG